MGRTPQLAAFQTASAGAKRFGVRLVLYRSCLERGEAHDKVSPIVRRTRTVKAPEDWRTPQPCGLLGAPIASGAFDVAPALWSAAVPRRFGSSVERRSRRARDFDCPAPDATPRRSSRRQSALTSSPTRTFDRACEEGSGWWATARTGFKMGGSEVGAPRQLGISRGGVCPLAPGFPFVTHGSGLPAHRAFFVNARTPRRKEIRGDPLSFAVQYH